MTAPGTLRNAGRARNVSGPRGEAGYTLLLAIFIAALMLIAASVAVPDLITQARRQKEKLMIWRGRQYARAIGLYYHQTGHFPHNLRELYKGVNDIHFLRQRYKDPMNSQDGSWRLIYLGQGGQLIGSLCWQTMAEYQAAEMGVPLPGTKEPPRCGQPIKLANGKTEGLTLAGSDEFSPAKGQIITEGQMVGGNLIGVASKVDAPSQKVYMGAKNYRQWEFIWNPLQGQQTGQPGASPLGGPTTPQTGTAKSPFGSLFQPPTQPPQQPQQP